MGIVGGFLLLLHVNLAVIFSLLYIFKIKIDIYCSN